MSQENLIKIQCGECKSIIYAKKTKATKDKLELKKYCHKCRKHMPHKETKK